MNEDWSGWNEGGSRYGFFAWEREGRGGKGREGEREGGEGREGRDRERERERRGKEGGDSVEQSPFRNLSLLGNYYTA